MFAPNLRRAPSFSPLRFLESALLAGLLAATGLAACGHGGDPAAAPSELEYTVPAALVVGTSYSFAPTVTGTVDTYSVSPALPAGLSLDATTGVLSGTPSAPTASAPYTITATNRRGSATATFSTAVVAQTYAVRATVSGLTAGTLVLAINGGDLLTVTENGVATFATRLPSGASYAVTVAAQPANPAHVCSVENGSGSVSGADVTDVAVICVLRRTFVYTNDHSTPGGTVFGFAADPTTGALTRVASAALPGGAYPAHLVAAPDGRWLYVSGGDASSVTRMAIDAASGALAVAETTTVSQPATALAIDPSGRFLYVASSSPNVIDAFAVDPSSGALTTVAGSPFAVFSTTSDLSIDRTGSFLVRSMGGNRSAGVFAIDATTGALAPVPGSPFTIDGEAWEVVVSPTADLVLFTDYRDSWLMMYAIDPTTGVLTPAPGEPYADVPSVAYAAFDPTGRFVYATAGNLGTQISGHSVDSSGQLAPLAGSPFSAPDRLMGIGASPDGRFAYVASGSEVVGYTVDATTGALAAIPGSGAARAFPWEVVVVIVP